MNYDTLLLDAISWAREAGAIHMRYFRSKNLDIRTKFNDSDIVTEADRQAEALLIAHINERYPDHAIMSEESGSSGSDASEYRWIIDPLDGTTNFSSGLPLFSVSIGIEHNGNTVIGIVYAPYLNELFHAVRGEGAYLNGDRIYCNTTEQLSKSVIATGFPVDKNINPDNNLDNFSRVLPLVRGIRRLGSAALDLCYVGAGILDGYWEMNLHQWDVSAGLLIASEAGAFYSHFREDREVSIVAAAPGIFADIEALLSSEAYK